MAQLWTVRYSSSIKRKPMLNKKNQKQPSHKTSGRRHISRHPSEEKIFVVSLSIAAPSKLGVNSWTKTLTQSFTISSLTWVSSKATSTSNKSIPMPAIIPTSRMSKPLSRPLTKIQCTWVATCPTKKADRSRSYQSSNLFKRSNEKEPSKWQLRNFANSKSRAHSRKSRYSPLELLL